MEILTCSAISFGEYLAVTNSLDLGDVWKELLIALGICVINSILIPITKWLFALIKSRIKKHQKTPENDGELADKILEGLDQAQEKVIDELTDLTNKGVKNGTDKDGKDNK